MKAYWIKLAIVLTLPQIANASLSFNQIFSIIEPQYRYTAAHFSADSLKLFAYAPTNCQFFCSDRSTHWLDFSNNTDKVKVFSASEALLKDFAISADFKNLLIERYNSDYFVENYLVETSFAYKTTVFERARYGDRRWTIHGFAHDNQTAMVTSVSAQGEDWRVHFKNVLSGASDQVDMTGQSYPKVYSSPVANSSLAFIKGDTQVFLRNFAISTTVFSQNVTFNRRFHTPDKGPFCTNGNKAIWIEATITTQPAQKQYGTLYVYDFLTAQVSSVDIGETIVYGFEISPGCDYVAVERNFSGDVVFIDVNTLNIQEVARAQSPYFAGDGENVLRYEVQQFKLYNLRTGVTTPIPFNPSQDYGARHLFSSTDKLLIWIPNLETYFIYSLTTGEHAEIDFNDYKASFSEASAEFSPDGNKLRILLEVGTDDNKKGLMRVFSFN